MILLDGKRLRDQKIIELKKKVNLLKQKPHLVMIQIGNNLGSNIYLKHKQNFCKKLKIKSTKINYPSSISFNNLKQKINKLNKDKDVDGILVQFPLPKKMSRRKVALLIDPKKDVDGIHPFNQGINVTNTNFYSPKPCTPLGVMEIFKKYNIKLKSKYTVVIGRSNIAGRPLANMLINADATVTQVHSKTPQKVKKKLFKDADIIVTATGVKNIFNKNDVKKGVIIIDVGVIREKNKIRGDIKYKDFYDKASYITPVPGGVGPMTVAMLMENIIKIKENQK